MPFVTRNRISILFVILLVAIGGWLFYQRFHRVALENYVPESALGYLEVNDLPQLLDHFVHTEAWQQLAPIYEVKNGLQYAGWASWLGRWTGIGTKETLLFSRGQFVVVVSGIEVRGDEVKPRIALVMETHGSNASVKALMSERLPKLAERAYRQPIQENSEYAGTPISIYRAPQGERQILSAAVGSTWIIANDAEALQSCIDVRQGRRASMGENNLLALAKTEVKQSGDIFAFVSQSGASRLSQFFTHLVLGKALDGTPLAGLAEGLIGEITQGTVEAMAYTTSFADGGVQDRYAVLCKPEAAASIRSAFRVPEKSELEKSPALSFVPPTAQEVTLVNLEDPGLALDGAERIVSAHLGAAQSFLFHKFFTSARKTFLGLEPGEDAVGAVGTEVVRYSLPALGENKSDRVWVIAARNRQKLSQMATRLLQQQGAGIGRIAHQGIELTVARDGKRAFAFLGNYLVLSQTEHVRRLIESHHKQSGWVKSEPFTTARIPAQTTPSLMYNFSSIAEETRKMMEIAARRFKGKPQADATKVLDRLPWAATVTLLTEHGIYREANSPVGNFPLAVAFIDTVF